jgi:RNA polymerase sigma factor (sigma-70 family)
MGRVQSDSQAIVASLVDPHAFAVIFERHFSSIHGYLRRRFDRELAKDLTAQTFFVAFDRRSRFDPQRADARPWLFGIAINVAHSHRRVERAELRAIATSTPELGVWIEGVEARVDAERMRGLLAQSLADLPAEEADVVCLLVWAELNQAEIADALAIPLGTVKSRLSRARGRLRLALGLGSERRTANADPMPPGGNQWTS